jgi:FtsP/CotA-like multicopper oxidase with cupredoxin domain
MASTINASSSATTGVITTADASGALTLQTNGTDALVLSSGKVINPSVTNYTETPYSANSSTAITIALTNGTVQIITLTGNATITMPTAVSGKSFIMYLRQDATGSRSVTWSTVNWAGGTAPTITGTASKQDIYSFFSDGTSWYGVTVGQNYTQ